MSVSRNPQAGGVETPTIAPAAGQVVDRQPLRVCHLAYTFYESDNRVLRYAESLASRGDTVDVIALRRPGSPARAELSGVQIHRIQRRSVNERQAWTYLLKIATFAVRSAVVLGLRQLSKPYDVVHVHNVPDFLVFAALVPKLLGARVVLDIHDIVPELYAGKFGVDSVSPIPNLLMKVERASSRFADHVIVANHLWEDKLVQRSVSAGKCTTLMNYPNTTLFRPMATPRNGAERFVMLYHGTLNHHQGLDIAVDAFSKVSCSLPTAELHIYGEGPARSGLLEQVARLGLNDRIKFRDSVPLAEIARIVASANVGIVPKRADGFGNEAFSTKVLEFMACRVPVIVARTKVDNYYFRDGVVRFFEPGNADDLAAQMRWTLEHPAEVEDVASAGEAYALEHSWEKSAGRYLAIVDDLNGRRRPRASPTKRPRS